MVELHCQSPFSCHFLLFVKLLSFLSSFFPLFFILQFLCKAKESNPWCISHLLLLNDTTTNSTAVVLLRHIYYPIVSTVQESSHDLTGPSA